LLAEPKRPGEPKLRALGTQLYVRYYGTEDHSDPTPPEDPPIELKATELKLASLPPVKASQFNEVKIPASPAQTLGVFHSNHATDQESTTFGLSQILVDALRSNGGTTQEDSATVSLSQTLGAALRSIHE